jgi:hypothetical protein
VLVSLVLLAMGVAALPFAPGVGADEPTVLASAEVESFALRVEYDIPLPVSPGTIPHVVGDVRSSGAGENAHGLAAAPTHFDAVVGGTYFDPGKDDESVMPCAMADRSACNFPPQAECFYPGDLLDTDFRFPTETRESLSALPSTSYATARCSAGPEIELHAVGAGDGPAASVASAAAHADARPVEGVMQGSTSARAKGINLAGGAITVASIETSGHSEVTGKPGGQRTEAKVALTDINAGGTRFSIANDQLLIAGSAIPVDSSAAQSFIDSVNDGLAPSRCTLALGTNPARYPQGFLLSRKEPRIGVAEDGSYAASMKGGLIVLCDLPDELGTGTDFKPQRLQAVLGFAYTSAAADDEPGGFGIGNLADVGVLGETSAAPSTGVPPLPDLAPLAAPLDAAAAPPADPAQLTTRRAAVDLPPPLGDFDMDPATRWLLALVSVITWAALTHAGIRRLQHALVVSP